MRKMVFAAFLTLPFLLAFPVHAQRQMDWDKVEVKLQKLSGNVYMIEFVSPGGGNAGANASALIGYDGVVLVDAGYAPAAPKLEAALKTISDKPVKYLLNTHWHGDHSDANAYFGKAAVIIAQDNARKKMEKGGGLFPPSPAIALPAITFDDRLTLHT